MKKVFLLFVLAFSMMACRFGGGSIRLQLPYVEAGFGEPPTVTPTPLRPVPPTATLPPTKSPATPPTATLPPMTPPPTLRALPPTPTQVSCPTEREFEELTGVPADVVGTEPCAFHWRGDPEIIRAKNPCPEGWICTLGLSENQTKQTYVFKGDDTLESAYIFAGTWRLISEFPNGDAVHNNPCTFLEKVREEGRVSDPQWTVRPGNFSCP